MVVYLPSLSFTFLVTLVTVTVDNSTPLLGDGGDGFLPPLLDDGGGGPPVLCLIGLRGDVICGGSADGALSPLRLLGDVGCGGAGGQLTLSLTVVEVPRILPVRLAAMRPAF